MVKNYIDSKQLKFQIDRSKKKMLLEGLDEIGLTLKLECDISDYEKSHTEILI